MDRSRRDILKNLGRITAGIMAVSVPAPSGATEPRHGGLSGRRWGMLVDLGKCIGCQACTVACIMENQVPLNSFRTFVSTYEVTDGVRTGTALLPRLCNHCSNPPCVPVCPVGATYRQVDGAVVIDSDRCVGCAYCVQACPYDARFINHLTRTADKCTFCGQRLAAGLLPACVETCVGGARIFGDLNDESSELNRTLDTRRSQVMVLKPDEQTEPNVFYLGLDERLQGRVDGQSTLWHPIEDTER